MDGGGSSPSSSLACWNAQTSGVDAYASAERPPGRVATGISLAMTHTGTVTLRVNGELANELTHILRPGTGVGPPAEGAIRSLPSHRLQNWHTSQPRPRPAARDGRHRIGHSAEPGDLCIQARRDCAVLSRSYSICVLSRISYSLPTAFCYRHLPPPERKGLDRQITEPAPAPGSALLARSLPGGWICPMVAGLPVARLACPPARGKAAVARSSGSPTAGREQVFVR